MIECILVIILYFFFVFIFKNKNVKERFSEIPLNIFTTWHTKDLPPKMKQTFEKIKENNPEFNVQLYDENDCREFIKNNYSKEVLDAFDCLIPQAFKSDLWRYCVLYKYGGIYYDIKFKPENNFKFLSLTDKEYFVKDPNHDDPVPPGTIFGVLNGIMIVKQKNTKLKNAIDNIVKNVKNKYYSETAIGVTGPLLLSLFWTQDEINNFEYIFKKPNAIMNKNTKEIILKMYDEYRDEQSKFGKGKHYDTCFRERNIYNC